MPKYERREFSSEIEAKEFIREKGFSLKGSPLIPNDKDLGINECFLVRTSANESSFGGTKEWTVVSRLPAEKNKSRPL